MKSLVIINMLLFSAGAVAHSGHLMDESVHGSLHSEHIVMLVSVAVIAYLVKSFLRK